MSSVVCTLPAIAKPTLSDQPQVWFSEMQNAMKTKNYRMVYMIVYSNKLRPMRYLHGRIQHKEVALALPLNGASHLTYRVDHHLVMQQPTQQPFYTESPIIPYIYPKALYADWETVSQSYTWKIERPYRIAGREAQMITIKPHDPLRYSYHLYLDKASCLPLQFDTFYQGSILESMTALDLIETSQPDQQLYDVLLAPFPTKKTIAQQLKVDEPWHFNYLPQGFKATHFNQHKLNSTNIPVAYWRLSDGLTELSVYVSDKIEPELPTYLTLNKSMNMITYSPKKSAKEIVIMGALPKEMMLKVARNMKPSQ